MWLTAKGFVFWQRREPTLLKWASEAVPSVSPENKKVLAGDRPVLLWMWQKQETNITKKQVYMCPYVPTEG